MRRAHLPAMLGYAALGAVLAGIYGIIHDQITYSISPEYFTRLKFVQFQYANFNLPPRVFVAEIGFLATWWVGFFAAWFLARITVPAREPANNVEGLPAWTREVAHRITLRGLGVVFITALAGTTAGYVFGLLHQPDYSAWEKYTSGIGVIDLPSFVRVAYIHDASYLGGLLGLVLALIYVGRLRRKV